MLKVKVHEAGIHDEEGAKLLLGSLAGRFPRMTKVCVDSAYRGLSAWLKETLGRDPEVVKHRWTGFRGVWSLEGQGPPPIAIPAGFQVPPRRWVVERTFGWLGRNRRLSKSLPCMSRWDYEFLPETEEAFIYVGMVRVMIRRLAGAL